MKKKTAHYVDNKKFLEAMKEWKEKCREAEETGEERPQISNYVGECFLKIANGLSYRPNFINYTYKEDMISDGIENCLQYIPNFNPDKSNNPLHILHKLFTMPSYEEFKEKRNKHTSNIEL